MSPSLYGLVFGIFELGQFLFAPLAGYLIPHLGTKFSLTIGLFITGWCTVVFGSLQWCPGGMTYFWLAFILRFVSSTGAAAYFTASFTLIATDFSERISSLFVSKTACLFITGFVTNFIHDEIVQALTEVCFGVGMIVGPSVGGVLFEAGGFAVPFFVTGAICFVCSIFSFFALKPAASKSSLHVSSCVMQLNNIFPSSGINKDVPTTRVSVWSMTKKPGIMINILISFTTFINVGFNDATLEHHLRDVSCYLSPLFRP